MACRSLGFVSGAQILSSTLSALPGEAGDMKRLRIIGCLGDEANLGECEFRSDYSTDYGSSLEDAAVALVCSNPSGAGPPSTCVMRCACVHGEADRAMPSASLIDSVFISAASPGGTSLFCIDIPQTTKPLLTISAHCGLPRLLLLPWPVHTTDQTRPKPTMPLQKMILVVQFCDNDAECNYGHNVIVNAACIEPRADSSNCVYSLWHVACGMLTENAG